MAFRDLLRRKFGRVNKEQHNVIELKQIVQRNTVHKYTRLFIALTALVPCNDKMLHDMFKDGLKDTILDELARDELPDTLAQLISMVDHIDQHQEIH